MPWEAVEPKEKGVYDEDYLNKVEALINKLGKNGIYTMLDSHQDLQARALCGDGMPTHWANTIIENS